MPVINRVADLQAEIVGWRHDFHRQPELLYDVERTAARVAELLRAFGVDEVVTGIGRTGVVGLIRGREAGGGRVVGLRADMDALPIIERTGRPYASTVPGKMHACGHDGHMSMLLGAAKYLAETRNFAGTIALIFQPAEEGGGGGRAMVEDGLMERFDITEVFGLHNMPGIPLGHFAIRPGGIMASTGEFEIVLQSQGGHAAMPDQTADPIVAAAQIIVALQTIVARNVNPLRSAVLTVTTVNGGTAHNIIPREVKLTGTIRTLQQEVRTLIEKRLHELVTQLAAAFGVTAEITLHAGYPVTHNAPQQTAFAARVARDIAGDAQVADTADGTMGGEDFAYMLEARPGAFIFLGNGESSPLHSDTYDFNDEALPYGVSYWIRLAELALPLEG
jgi:hippurate hydrolase